jgi:hypothetical protein
MSGCACRGATTPPRSRKLPPAPGRRAAGFGAEDCAARGPGADPGAGALDSKRNCKPPPHLAPQHPAARRRSFSKSLKKPTAASSTCSTSIGRCVAAPATSDLHGDLCGGSL